MAKKIDEAEVKKECPSCGLGVALDATICEFCGWDFEEEDEWILQIEKLERDLMLEKQKFEPGSINERIESSLHAPTLERIEAIKSGRLKPAEQPPAAPKTAYQEPKTPPAVRRQEPLAQRAMPPAPPEGKVRRVRSVKAAPQTVQEPEPAEATKKVRVVRKVKQ